MKLEFTKKELYEIEKIFDLIAGQGVQGAGQTLSKLDPKHELSKKFLGDALKTYDLHRTISARAKILREEQEVVTDSNKRE